MVNIGNSLPNEVVEADTVNALKYRLDKHWSNQDVFFDFNANLTGTGSYQFVCDRNLCTMQAERTTCTRQNTFDWIGLGCVKCCKQWKMLFSIPRDGK